MRVITSSLWFLLAGLLLAGCVSDKELHDQSAQADSANRIITCEDGADCQEKWVRAWRWVRANATYPITAETDTRIETAGPSVLDSHLGFTVVKKSSPKTPETLSAKNTSNIVLFTRCNDWFGCTPPKVEAKASFVDFVIGKPAPKPVLGAKVIPLTKPMAQEMKMSNIQGVGVTAVAANSLASRAGLREDDVITRFNGNPVASEESLNEMVGNTPPGKRVSLDIIRGYVQQTLTVNF